MTFLPAQRAARRTPARRAICIAALVLVGMFAAVIWHDKRPKVEARAMEFRAFCQSPVAEYFARKDRRNALTARFLLSSFGDLGRYAVANHQLPPAEADRVVLYGDSITDFWPSNGAREYFPGHAYLNRGISGQATPELLWRFRQDVLDLHPGTVVILGGANDILLRGRHIGLTETEHNLQTMVEAAQRQHVRVVLCQLTPVFTGYPDRHRRLTREIRELNLWIRIFAQRNSLATVDYFDAMALPDGTLRPDLTLDGVHPNDAGYALMLPLAQKAIDRTK